MLTPTSYLPWTISRLLALAASSLALYTSYIFFPNIYIFFYPPDACAGILCYRLYALQKAIKAHITQHQLYIFFYLLKICQLLYYLHSKYILGKRCYVFLFFLTCFKLCLLKSFYSYRFLTLNIQFGKKLLTFDFK